MKRGFGSALAMMIGMALILPLGSGAQTEWERVVVGSEAVLTRAIIESAARRDLSLRESLPGALVFESDRDNLEGTLTVFLEQVEPGQRRLSLSATEHFEDRFDGHAFLLEVAVEAGDGPVPADALQTVSVRHKHGGMGACLGMFFVRETRIGYFSYGDEEHSFEVDFSEVDEVKVPGFVGSAGEQFRVNLREMRNYLFEVREPGLTDKEVVRRVQEIMKRGSSSELPTEGRYSS